MDKLKSGLAVVKKYHFWILCVAVVAAGVGVWWIATAGVKADIETKISAIESDFSSAQSVASKANHPNDKVNTAHEARLDVLKDDVLRAWTKLYNAQKTRNVLPGSLSADFHQRFARVFEARAKKEEAEFPSHHLQQYWTFIDKHLSTLFSRLGVVGFVPPAADDGTPAPPHREIVVLSEERREALREACRWDTLPSTEEVLVAQEDLWVYEALLRIIENINTNATSYHDALIKEIQELEIGHSAYEKTLPEMHEETITPGSRYLDDEGKMIAPDGEHPYAEFKIMPIFMKLKINQLSIAELLVELANSSMPVEVTKVTINPGEGETVEIAEYSGTAFSPSRDDGGGTTSLSSMSGSSAPEDAVESELDVVVSIKGQIYIYNPPDEETLGTGSAAGETGDEDADETTAPAADPADEASIDGVEPGLS